MFEHLKKYNRIFVTGLARSGTRIATRMIAHDTGKEFIDETEWGIVDLDELAENAKYRDNFVVHAVNAYFCMDRFVGENDLVVWVKRDLEDIKESWKRIRSKGLDSSKLLWKIWDFIKRLWMGIPKEITLPMEERLKLWNEVKGKVNHIEIEYEDLKGHPMWVDKEQRSEFLWHQTYENQYSISSEEKILHNL